MTSGTIVKILPILALSNIHINSCKTGPCKTCDYNELRLFEDNEGKPPVGFDNHFFCDCYYEGVETLYNDDLVEWGLATVVRSLRTTGELPSYYISKEQAIQLGWDNSKNTVAGKVPGKMLGGDRYQNFKEILPVKSGRIWYECDVNYQFGRRNSLRLYYSNDGLMFFSPDHGLSSFYYIKKD